MLMLGNRRMAHHALVHCSAQAFFSIKNSFNVLLVLEHWFGLHSGLLRFFSFKEFTFEIIIFYTNKTR